jgi:hypothetical protein
MLFGGGMMSKLPSTIEELFAGFDYDAYNRAPNNQEIDWGKPVGDEIW